MYADIIYIRIYKHATNKNTRIPLTLNYYALFAFVSWPFFHFACTSPTCQTCFPFWSTAWQQWSWSKNWTLVWIKKWYTPPKVLRNNWEVPKQRDPTKEISMLLGVLPPTGLFFSISGEPFGRLKGWVKMSEAIETKNAWIDLLGYFLRLCWWNLQPDNLRHVFYKVYGSTFPNKIAGKIIMAYVCLCIHKSRKIVICLHGFSPSKDIKKNTNCERKFQGLRKVYLKLPIHFPFQEGLVLWEVDGKMGVLWVFQDYKFDESLHECNIRDGETGSLSW